MSRSAGYEPLDVEHEMTQPAGSLLFSVDDERAPLATSSSNQHRQRVKDVDARSGSDEYDDDADTLHSSTFPPSAQHARGRSGSGGSSSHGSQLAGPAGVHLATMAQKRALWWRDVLITGMFILSWYSFATLLSLYNTWMFSNERYGFSYPLFVSACHMVVQFTLAFMIRIFWASRFRPVERPTRRDYVTRIVPTAWATGTDIGLSNLSLKTITLSLYTMCKSSALIFVVMFAFMFGLERWSLRLLAVIMLISFGVFCMVFDTTTVSIPGIIMVFSASAVGGLRWALTEVVMHRKAMGVSNPFATIFWLAPIMGVCLFIVSLGVESWHDMFTSRFFDGPLETLKTIAIIALPGSLAFSMVASEYFIIQRAGVVPLSIAGIFKEVSTISFAHWVFGDELTQLNVVGVVITISGIALYSYHKYQKSIHREVRLDAGQHPIEDETAPLTAGYTRAPRDEHDLSADEADDASPQHDDPDRSVSPGLRPDRDRAALQLHVLTTPSPSSETSADRTARLRDEFEGWDAVGGSDEEDDDDDDCEVDDEEVVRQRAGRVGAAGGRAYGSRWDEFWDKPM